MSVVAVFRVVLVAVVIGLVAWAAETLAGLAPWAMLVGVGISVAGRPPAVHRGLTALAGAAGALLLLGLLPGAETAAAGAAVVAVLVLVAGLLRRRDDARMPSWALLVGGGVLLAGTRAAGEATLAAAAPVLGGLIAGLVPMLVAEVLAAGGDEHGADAPASPVGSPAVDDDEDADGRGGHA